ncbi:helix-turn-helix domain-containing protein [Streptomyces sp. SID8376]|uniref:helix-turn-helix domain-containing protein n=1 Tax=Streptomyces sp. SID8376 TaxID=2690356 RepID=UPI0003A02133|nr:helix-turn-helix domain-containing protein [Streptomyces sp. SID8376]
MSTLTTWAQAHLLPAVIASAVALAVVAALAVAGRRAVRRTPGAVLMACVAALACTAYSADTSWRFAAHSLDMVGTTERAAMFAAAELALFATALMARQNLRTQGAPGVPGALVWFITGVQVIPAYSESGIVGGTVRAVVGPILAALLWHLAMGIELRHRAPGSGSGSLPALLARELRERLLSRLGLAVRDRSAEQITRDRWTVKAVALAAKLADMPEKARGRARVARRLSVAVGKAEAGASEEQRTKLLELLAARRHAAALATIDLPSPWQDTPQDTEDTQDAPASCTVRPFPVPVPHGARLLPIVARPAAPTPAGQDLQDAPEDSEDGDDGPPPEPPLMTTADVADHYGIKPSTARNWVAAGRIPVHSKDATGRNLFHPNDLPNFHVGVPV